MKELVQKLIGEGHLKTSRIIEAFLGVDRKDFVTEEMKPSAYEDIALPTVFGQTISQPTTVAFMLELLQPKKGDSILDIGAGSCWQTALLAHIVGFEGSVYAIERLCPLLEWGKENVQKYGFTNTSFFCQDGTKGLPEHAPFDNIIAAASGREMMRAWQDQLNIGGRIVMPIGHSIWLYTKKSATEFEKHEHYGFSFVPLIEG
ncbi:protein-L-isoaspartate O-methyltransferase [Candidatus Azambacteria bacterium]|nr:protein-L-isoaspartate O-methyltransferase [Candidatus Azambacteria bacterium]